MDKVSKNVKISVVTLAMVLATSMPTQGMAAWEDRSNELPGLKSTSDVLTPVLIVTGVVLVALLIKKAKRSNDTVALFKEGAVRLPSQRAGIEDMQGRPLWRVHSIINRYPYPSTAPGGV